MHRRYELGDRSAATKIHQVFDTVRKAGSPEASLFKVVMNMLVKEDHTEALEKCISLFQEMRQLTNKKSMPDLGAYNIAMNAHRKLADRGNTSAAHRTVKLFTEIGAVGMMPDDVSFSTLMSALAKPIELGDVVSRNALTELLEGRVPYTVKESSTFVSGFNLILNALSRRYRLLDDDASTVRACVNEIVEKMAKVAAEQGLSEWGPNVQTYSSVMYMLASDVESAKDLDSCLSLLLELRQNKSLQVSDDLHRPTIL